MPSGSGAVAKSTFARAVDALCVSRDDIARALGVGTAVLDAYMEGSEPVPPMTQLELVDVVKSHEAMLGAVAGSLYEESMYRLEHNSTDGTPLSADVPMLPPSRRPRDPS